MGGRWISLTRWGETVTGAGDMFKGVADGLTDQTGQAVGGATDKVGKTPGGLTEKAIKSA